jgi:hypothetical protein
LPFTKFRDDEIVVLFVDGEEIRRSVPKEFVDDGTKLVQAHAQ